MVAPLDIYVMVLHQLVEDMVGTRAAVEQVADDMQPVHGQLLNQVAQRHNQRFGNPGKQHRVNNLPEIAALVRVGVVGQQQLIEHKGIIRVHTAVHARTGVLAGDLTADLHQPVNRDFTPFVEVLRAAAALPGKVSLGIVDDRRQLIPVGFQHGLAKQVVHLAADDARA